MDLNLLLIVNYLENPILIPDPVLFIPDPVLFVPDPILLIPGPISFMPDPRLLICGLVIPESSHITAKLIIYL